ncbi:MAG: hypothetical protein BWY69_00005 [Planctomycetes bacterium ADurb.Bin401]|nr:MAG: hypothetical protein BWY69_00005 [Planctomycetes bacterium ADurb.Bin401]
MLTEKLKITDKRMNNIAAFVGLSLHKLNIKNPFIDFNRSREKIILLYNQTITVIAGLYSLDRTDLYK